MEAVILLLERFGELIQTPADVEKLNTAVLGWAVQGRLVEQDPNDEPASISLQRIRAKRDLLAKWQRKSLSQEKEAVLSEDLSYGLPIGWVACKLGELIELEYGESLPSKKREDEGNVPVYGSNGIVGKHTKPLINTPCIVVGRKGSSGAINVALEPCWVIDTAFFVIPPAEIDLLFLAHLLKSLNLDKLGKGIKPGLNRNEAYQLTVPLPPFDEQKWIVEKVEIVSGQTQVLARQMGEVAEKRQATRQAALRRLVTAESTADVATAWAFIAQHFHDLYTEPEAVQELKQAILQLAMQGRLVPQDPDDEPAAVLLVQVHAEKGAKEAGLPIGEAERPFSLPIGWEWVRLDSISQIVEYGTSEKADEISGVPILRMNNIVNGKVVLDSLKYVSKGIADLPRLYLVFNDLLFNRTNSYELVGKTGVFKGPNNKFTFASYLIRVRLFASLIESDYINFYFNSPSCRSTQIEPHITQQTGQANFNGTKLKSVLVPLPPHSEQKKIVAKVNELFSLCDQLAAQLTTAQTAREQALTTVLARAV